MTSSILDQLRVAFNLDEETCVHDIIESIQGRMGAEYARGKRDMMALYDETYPSSCGHQRRFFEHPMAEESNGNRCVVCELASIGTLI